jgi:type IV pilus assembly protein PilZ
MPRRAEKRRCHRATIGIPVAFSSKDSSDAVAGIATDISIGGMFIETASPAAFGAVVVISFSPPGTTAMRMSATVRWTTKTGMGVQFGLLGAQDTHTITEIQREHSASGR